MCIFRLLNGIEGQFLEEIAYKQSLKLTICCINLVPRRSFLFWVGGSLVSTVCACSKITVNFVYIV